MEVRNEDKEREQQMKWVVSREEEAINGRRAMAAR